MRPLTTHHKQLQNCFIDLPELLMGCCCSNSKSENKYRRGEQKNAYYTSTIDALTPNLSKEESYNASRRNSFGEARHSKRGVRRELSCKECGHTYDDITNYNVMTSHKSTQSKARRKKSQALKRVDTSPSRYSLVDHNDIFASRLESKAHKRKSRKGKKFRAPSPPQRRPTNYLQYERAENSDNNNRHDSTSEDEGKFVILERERNRLGRVKGKSVQRKMMSVTKRNDGRDAYYRQIYGKDNSNVAQQERSYSDVDYQEQEPPRRVLSDKQRKEKAVEQRLLNKYLYKPSIVVTTGGRRPRLRHSTPQTLTKLIKRDRSTSQKSVARRRTSTPKTPVNSRTNVNAFHWTRTAATSRRDVNMNINHRPKLKSGIVSEAIQAMQREANERRRNRNGWREPSSVE